VAYTIDVNGCRSATVSVGVFTAVAFEDAFALSQRSTAVPANIRVQVPDVTYAYTGFDDRLPLPGNAYKQMGVGFARTLSPGPDGNFSGDFANGAAQREPLS
jgi:hypothetical protein